MSGKTRLTDWKPGQKTSAAHLQEAWDMLKRVATVMGWDTSTDGNDATPKQFSWVLGRVSGAGPAAEADYTDARYWVREVYILHGATPQAALTFADFLPWDPGDGGAQVAVIHTVTNLPELIEDSHNLEIDTPVIFLRWHDAIDDTTANGRSNTRNIMMAGGSVGAGEFIGMNLVTVAQNVSGWNFDMLHSEL